MRESPFRMTWGLWDMLWSEQEIAGMYHNNRRIGASAVDWVSGKFQRGQFGFGPSVHRILVASDWLENKTLAARAP